MLKTLRISFALKNTYRVNGILHSLKQIPLLKRVLPDRLYQVRGLKIFANVLGIPLDMVKTEQGPGYGAAMLAMVGCGKFASVQEAAGALVETASTTEPAAALTAKYEARYQNFKKLYPALKDFFAATV